jgi:hypothetical protein
MWCRFLIAIALVVVVAAPHVSAQSARGKRTTIDFEDELIEGEAATPELLYLMQKKQFNFKKLIKLREDFKPEMHRTGEYLKGGKK